MESKLVQSKFYEFYQNNSGGGFDHDADSGIGYKVVIEAFNHNEANSKAEGIGIYFEGVRDGMDCECCGDRWSEVSENYTTEVDKVSGGWGIPSYIHYLNGLVREVK